MKSNAVFYISEGQIRFLQIAGTPKKPVTAVEVISLVKKDDAAISQALTDFVKQRKLNFSESRVTLVVPRSRAILRTMVFPSLQEDEIRSMIDLQVGNRIPYAREEVEIDFQILSKTPEGYAKVAVVIIPQEIALRYWKLFADARIPVSGITISSIGLWLLYQQQAGLTDQLGAVFDLDTDRSEVSLCHKAYWLTSREIPVGFEQMQKDGYVEVLKQWELTQNIAGAEKPPESLGSVYLVSSSDKANMLAAEMAKLQSNLTIKEVHLTKSLNLARGVVWPKLIAQDGVSMASLAGIALSAQKPPIDLVPRSVRQAQEEKSYRRQLLTLGIWGVVAVISIGLAFGMGYFRKSVQLSRIEAELREAKGEALKVEAELKKVYGIEGVIKNRLIFSDLAHEIYRLLPAQVYLVSISINDGNTLSLQGMSTNSVEINHFQRDMVDSSIFSNVSLDYVNKRVTQQGEVDYFKITSTLKSMNGKNEKT